jgi:hypothetical protein
MVDLPPDGAATPQEETAPPSPETGSAVPAKAAAANGAGIKGFFAKPSNRAVAIVLAVVALLTVLGVAAAIVMGSVGSGNPQATAGSLQNLKGRVGIGGWTPESTKTAETTGTAKPAKPVTTPTSTSTAPKQVSLVVPPTFEVFTANNDPFKPAFVPTSAATSGGGTTTNGGSENPTSQATEASSTIKPGINVLYLAEITSTGGANHAIVYWNNVRYDVTEGKRIDESPWKLISLGSSSGTFLYGDVRVTLRVGEQLGK